MNDPPNGFVKVSNREIYDSLRNLQQEVAAMRLDLTNILGENVELNKRVRSLELKFYSILAGFVGAASIIATFIAQRGWH